MAIFKAFKYLVALLLPLLSGLVSAQEGLPVVNMTSGTDGEVQYSLTLATIGVDDSAYAVAIATTYDDFVCAYYHCDVPTQTGLGYSTNPPLTRSYWAWLFFLTIFIMSPVLSEVYDEAITPYSQDQISLETAIETAQQPIRTFMLNQTRETDIAMFAEIAGNDDIEDPADVSFATLVPAFITSELKSAFAIGFLIYIPFVVIDLVVASVLMSMGMMMLSPMMISMPFKLMLFVLVDGWTLIMGSLASSFAVL